MTTPLFVEVANRGRLEAMLIQVSGDHRGCVELTHFETIDAVVKPDAKKHWNPLDHAEIKSLKKFRALCIWQKLSYAFIPGPSCFGRIVTLHCAWAPPGHELPKSAVEFQAMPGYEVCVFGGVGDPQFNKAWRAAPFSDTRNRVIFSNSLQTAGPMKLVWHMESADVGDKKGSGAFFFIRCDGIVDTYGAIH